MTEQYKRKKTSFLVYLNPKNLATEIHRCGFHFSLGDYIKYLLLVYASFGALAYFYKLKLVPILIILGVATLFLPSVFLITYRSLYERKKFHDLTNYMEQILYSFKRRSKILSALQDTLVLFPDGEMHEDILKAIDYIQNSNTTGNVYKEAFAFIEEDYGCKRLATLHNFLIKIEASGGEYDTSIDILLKDRKLWVDRVHELERDKKKVKINVTIGVALAFIVGLSAVYIVPETMSVSSHIASQAVTTIVFLVNMAAWYITNYKLSGSLIVERNAYTWEVIKRRYDLVFHTDLKKKKKKYLITGLILLPMAGYLFWKINFGVAIVTLILIYVIVTQPKRQYKTAYKKVQNEVEKVFPDWLLSMSLLLQTDNVHVALSKSIPEAPEILKEELTKLEEGINERPNSVEPFIRFMEKLDIADVLSAMKMLYAMAEYGSSDISKQIGALVERNAVMTDKAERLRAEDYLTGMGVFVLVPMMSGVCKLVVDMALIIFELLSIVKTL